MGPIALFDKSFLQGLSVDESVWFDHFFYPVIAPLFYIETLADLEKAPRAGRTAEEEVSLIAAKTPEMSGAPVYFHPQMVIGDLMGSRVAMDGRIPRAFTKTVMRDGKPHGVIEQPPEAKAFKRWQEGRFQEVERYHAREWREELDRIDLGAVARTMATLQVGGSSSKARTLEEARSMAEQVVLGLTKSYGRFDRLLDILDVPVDLRAHVLTRWKSLHKPPLQLFAPYACFVLTIEFFFRFALAASLISSERASNRVDVAYLNYLPFCSIFVSADKLHRSCAPVFLRNNQEFVWGPDLKQDLRVINQAFAKLPADVKELGIYRFARSLPNESQGIVRELFSRFSPNLLEPPVDLEKAGQENFDRLIRNMNSLKEAPAAAASEIPAGVELESLMIERLVHGKRGQWIQVAKKDS